MLLHRAITTTQGMKMEFKEMSMEQMYKELSDIKKYLSKKSPKYIRMIELQDEIDRIVELAKAEAKRLDLENHSFMKEDKRNWTVQAFVGEVTIEDRVIPYRIYSANMQAQAAYTQRKFTDLTSR